MAGLPKIPQRSELVNVGGTELAVRSLTRAEQVGLTALADDLDGAEVRMIALTLGFSEDEVRVWREDTPGDVVGKLVDDIARISGLQEGAQKSGGTPVPPAPR